MARIRSIKPEFFRHEWLFESERDTGLPLRIAFAGLLTAADREGRFKWSPRALKLDCLPYDDVDFSRVLDALATRGFIVKYRVDEYDYGLIPTFKKHQIINNRESGSTLPEPNENNILTREARVDDASSTRGARGFRGREGKGREGKGKESAPNGAHPGNGTEPKPSDPQADLFRRGREVLGEKAGGVIQQLLAAKGSPELARAAIEQAATKENPRSYIQRVIRGPPETKNQRGAII